MSGRKPHRSALVVSDDEGLSSAVADWLEADGMQVMVCPGPREPGYSCVGLDRGDCALTHGVSLVVLDLHPDGEQLFDTTRRTELVRHYTKQGGKVIAMMDASEATRLPAFAGVEVTGRLTTRELLLDLVHETLATAGRSFARALGASLLVSGRTSRAPADLGALAFARFRARRPRRV